MTLEVTHFVQQFNPPIFVSFIKLLNHLDTPPFLFVLIPAIWVLLGKKTGFKIFYILLLNGSINILLKSYFAEPRPFILDPSVGIIQVSGYSFPSGAAQTSALLSSLILYYWKSKLKWFIAPTYWLLMCFSRVYLGVHFLQDVIVGSAIGFSLLPIYVYLFPKIERWFCRFNLLELFYLSEISLLFLTLASKNKSLTHFFSVTLAVTLGYFLSLFFKFEDIKKHFIFKYLILLPIVISGTFLIYSEAQKLSISNLKMKTIIESFLVGIWLSFSPMLISAIFNKYIKRKKTL